jgi:uncharacterized protein DUF2804
MAPSPLPLVHAGRLRKRWTYVGAFGPEVMLCGGAAQVGPIWQSWWALWDRRAGRLRERTRPGRRAAIVRADRLRVPALELDLLVEPGAEVEVRIPDGAAWTWTRKRAGVRARGTLEGRPVELGAVVDESAGYHPRDTSWRWSAGVGTTEDGRAVAWNLVAGINDPPMGSERAVWVEGAPREVGPVRFAEDLSAIAFAEGGELRFAGEASRERNDNLLLLRSRYAQPFGTFTGELPGGLRLVEGYGVMERHEARW